MGESKPRGSRTSWEITAVVQLEKGRGLNRAVTVGIEKGTNLSEGMEVEMPVLFFFFNCCCSSTAVSPRNPPTTPAIPTSLPDPTSPLGFVHVSFIVVSRCLFFVTIWMKGMGQSKDSERSPEDRGF